MWTEARVETLRKLWAEGYSASQIAKQIGGVTRNAVIGKRMRLRLAARTPVARPASTQSVYARRTRTVKVAKEKPAPEAAPIPVEPLHIPFLERQVGQCRAITDATRNAQKVCGHLIEGDGVFCRWHKAIYYVAPDPKKKPRARA